MSKREQEKAIEATKQVAEYMRNATAKRFQESINTSLDETKENIKKSLDETRSQIPRYTNVVKNHQEQALESTGKTVENYLEAQKSIINSVLTL